MKLLKFSLVLIIFIHLTYKSNAQVLEQDSLALVALYNSTNGNDWNNNLNWLITPVADWNFVTVEGGRVVEVLIGPNNMVGTIPDEIGDLTELRSLDLIFNDISGSIPESIGNLTKLEYIGLAYNPISGTIPESFWNLTNLNQIAFGFNPNLSGVIPPAIGNLVNLEAFYLDNCNFEGDLPEELSVLINLNNLWLNGNNFTSLPDLSALNTDNLNLRVQNNFLDFADLEPNMVFANIIYSPQKNIPKVTDFILAEGNQFLLEYTVGGTANVYQWQKDGFDLIGEESNTINIPSITFADDGFYALNITNTNVPGLTLKTEDVFLQVTAPPTVITSDSLALVAIYNNTNGPEWTNNANWLSGPVDTWYGLAVENERVVNLDLSGNNLIGIIPPQLGNLDALLYLDLSSNTISGSIPAEIGLLSSLESLFLIDLPLTGNLPGELGNLTNIITLYIAFTDISGAIPPELGNLNNIDDLYLSANQLTGNIPAELGNLLSLTSLDLSENQLSGSIPTELGNLVNLYQLNLFTNQLSGTLPPSLANLTGLEFFYVDDNELSGDIPDSYVNLTALVFVGFSGNNFTRLPDFGSLLNISSFDARDNFFDFADLEPNIGLPGFSYIPQKNIAAPDTINLYQDATLSINIPVGGSANEYQWLKDELNIAGAISEELTIEFLSASDAGTYRLEIINAIVPGLTLTSNNIIVNVFQKTSPSDSLALVNLYNITDGNNWINKSNWLNGPVELWYGVNVSENRVDRLDLNNNNLNGLLTDDVSNLSDLFFLDLSNNNLFGQIPSSIGDLGNLNFLNLSSNQLEGEIPFTLENITGLATLILSNNQLSGNVPASLTTLPDLTLIRLENNLLVNLPQFTLVAEYDLFDVRNNYFTFEDLEYNMTFSGFEYIPQRTIPGLADVSIKQGEEFNLTYFIDGTANIYQWEKDGIEIGAENSDSILITSVLLSDSGSYVLKISNTLVGGLVLETEPTRLNVTLPPTVITADSLALVAFYNSTNGNTWTENTNWLNGPVDTWLGITVASERVTEINLPDNALSGTLTEEIGNLDGLTRLMLGTWESSNAISGNIPASIGNLSSLRNLDLRFNSFSGTLPESIGNLPQIESIEIIFNELSGELPSSIGNLSTLTRLDLWGNNFSGNIPPEIGNLNQLQILQLQENEFSGNIPASLGNLNNLNNLWLYGNQLSGNIPEELGNLTNLAEMHLRDNQLSGTLPSSFGNLINLDKLFISNNQLSGEIPGTISKLSNITQLVLSNNQFEGALPDSVFLHNNLQILWINNNQFSSIPDLSVLPALNQFSVQQNRLTFESLEPNISIPGFTYSPQDSVGLTRSIFAEPNQPLILSGLVGGSNNIYTWKKDGEIITGENNAELIIDNPSLADEGVYESEVSNSIVPGLILYSRPTTVFLNSLTVDSLALVALYESTNGDAWTNKTNWFEGPLNETWFGISITDNRVTGINLSNNNLSGEVPEEFTTIRRLINLNLSRNSITALPDLSTLTELVNVDVSENKLEFASLVNIANLPNINYQNQADIGTARNELVEAGEDYRMGFEVPGTGNEFNWTYNGNIIPDAQDSVYTITSIGRNNMGDYRLIITNPLVPGLTLQSANQNVLAVANIAGTLYYSKESDDDDDDNNDEPATQGIVSLFRITTSGAYDTTRVQNINNDGTFLLERVVLDDYLLLGQADTLVYEDALPTWFTQTIFWEEADTIFLNNNIADLDIISEKRPTEVLRGPGLFFGYFEEDLPDNGKFEKRERVKDAAVIVSRIERIARNEETIVLTLVAYVYTNENGEFVVEGLDQGTYRINIQYPGYPMDEKSFVEFNIGQGVRATIINVEALVINNKITVRQFIITGMEGNENYEVKVYPNPATEYLNLVFAYESEQRELLIYSQMGRLIKDIKIQAMTNVIELPELEAGLYLLRIKENNTVMKAFRLIIR
jgi:Leucine-rich repeat (LRR) protein